MSAFVGTSHKLLSVDELQSLIDKLANESSYYFLRWANRVSGITKDSIKREDFPIPEGQMFNEELELRWKQKGANYEALLLSKSASNYLDFVALDREWETEDRAALFYPETETRFPKGFNYPKNLNIAQRYFRDKQTATVHFVALTIQDH